MHSNFFTKEIKVTSIEGKRPTPLKWPSNDREWLSLLADIYVRQEVERESGENALSLEQKVVKRVIE